MHICTVFVVERGLRTRSRHNLEKPRSLSDFLESLWPPKAARLALHLAGMAGSSRPQAPMGFASP